MPTRYPLVTRRRDGRSLVAGARIRPMLLELPPIPAPSKTASQDANRSTSKLRLPRKNRTMRCFREHGSLKTVRAIEMRCDNMFSTPAVRRIREGLPMSREPALLTSAGRMPKRRRSGWRSQHRASEGQDVRSERPATGHGRSRTVTQHADPVAHAQGFYGTRRVSALRTRSRNSAR